VFAIVPARSSVTAVVLLSSDVPVKLILPV
jgi:hypothetical protein